jgi:glycosyltransferase involved in cell wall biosynthesis
VAQNPSDHRTRVSVIVPTKNRSQQLREALASIRAVDGNDLQIELIVIDNGSTDDSVEVAREFGALVLRNSIPGAAASRNLGLRTATAEFVAFLDDDDLWLPGHVRPHLALLRHRPELAAVVGQFVLTDAMLQNTGHPYPDGIPANGELFATFLNSYIPQVGATVARTSVRDTVGYFDPGMEGDEDWDWHLRLALSHNVGFTPTACMLFRMRPPGTNADVSWVRLRNTRRVFFRNVRRVDARRRPSLPSLARSYLRHNGRACGTLVDDAMRRARAGDLRGAMIGWSRAIRASPPHAVLHLVHRGLGIT